MEKVRVTSNVGSNGGVLNYGTVTIVDGSEVDGNTGGVGQGGGISNIGGTLTVRDSSIHDNQGGLGGGIHNSYGTTLIESSDLSSNRSTTIGGGYSNHNLGGVVSLTDVTLVGNTSDTGSYPVCYDVNPGNC